MREENDIDLGRWCRHCWKRIHAGCWRCIESLVDLTSHHCTSYRAAGSSAADYYSSTETAQVVRLLYKLLHNQETQWNDESA